MGAGKHAQYLFPVGETPPVRIGAGHMRDQRVPVQHEGQVGCEGLPVDRARQDAEAVLPDKTMQRCLIVLGKMFGYVHA